MAQFGRALRSGRRGRWFKSSRIDFQWHLISLLIRLMRFFFTGKWRMRTAKRILGRQEAAFFRLVIPLEENGQVTECRAAKENGTERLKSTDR